MFKKVTRLQLRPYQATRTAEGGCLAPELQRENLHDTRAARYSESTTCTARSNHITRFSYNRIILESATSPRWCSGYPRILLALVLEFDSHRGENLKVFAKMQKKDQLLRTPTSVGSHNSTRVDEARKCCTLDKKTKARTVVGMGEEGPLCDPGSELLLGGSAR